MTFKEFMNYELLSTTGAVITAGHIITLVVVLAIGHVFFLFFKRAILRPFFNRRAIDVKRQTGLITLTRYFYYLAILLVAFQMSGFKITVVLAAGAALLVGVGIGLQQTFNDLVSGVILLSEGAVNIGDWVEIQSTEGKVIKIGLRTSLIETRRGVVIIVPNSKLAVDNVVNITHNNSAIRYSVTVGVAYGSDIPKVKEQLYAAVNDVEGIMDQPSPNVRMTNFGDSSLDFELLFWSFEYQLIENVKSDLRCAIAERFRKHGVSIPFPQRDLHLIAPAELMVSKPEDRVT